MNVKARKTKKQAKVQNSSINVLSADELAGKVEAIKKELKSYTWRNLETNGKFTKNDKLSFISDEMLIVGCDIGSETHYIRAIDTRGREQTAELMREKTDITDYFTLWAHQIKTPIAAMRLLLQQDTEEIEQFYERRKECEGELFKIEQYVEMVLQYLRLNSSVNDFVLQEYSLDDIIRQAIHKYAPMFIRKKLALHYNAVDVKVVTDEKWLVFVVEQILSNAIKYTAEGGISIYMEEGMLVIKDTGIGILAEDLPRVFEKGYTGYNGRSDKKASGIGLYLCKQILQKLGHKVCVESEPGKGTQVKLVF